MDWNKSNTILIIAFIILNIFLLLASFSDIFANNSNAVSSEDYENKVENLLKSKNINIKCEIPYDTYVLPVLEAEYKIIDINNVLVQKYLGKSVEAEENVFIYTNGNNETLEIVDGKKIIYTVREKVPFDIVNDEFINQSIKTFIEGQELIYTGFVESNRYKSDYDSCITYIENYNGFNIDNSYMHFYVDKNGVYKFEMQRVNSVMEIKGKIRTTPAIESLSRLMTYDIKDKDIIDIKMTYFSREDENWKYITKINSDPTWKVIFSDGTEEHLSSSD